MKKPMNWILGAALFLALPVSNALACRAVPAVPPGESLSMADYNGTTNGSGGYTYAPGNGNFCPASDGSSCMALCTSGACTSELQKAACNIPTPTTTKAVYKCVPVGTANPTPKACNETSCENTVNQCLISSPSLTCSSGTLSGRTLLGKSSCLCPGQYIYNNPPCGAGGPPCGL